MAKIERLNKTILPKLADPAAVSRIAQPALIQSAGALARGVSQVADIGVGFLQTQKAEADRLQVLQDETDITRRLADFQTQSFDAVQQNREVFKNNPNESFDPLNQDLRKLAEPFSKGLSPTNMARFNRSVESSIGRSGLAQRQFAIDQTRTNVQDNVNATAKTYLESAKAAGESGDFQRLASIAEDAGGLRTRAGEVFDAKQIATFSADLERGIVENFSDAMMFNDPEGFIVALNKGFFDDVLDEDEITEKKKETQTYMDTLNKQALRDRSIKSLTTNKDLSVLVDQGTISFNDIDEFVAAGDISPEFGEAKRKELLQGKDRVKTDPVIYGNLKAEMSRLLEKRTISEVDDQGRVTVTLKQLAPEALEKALLLQQKIADAQATGKLKGSDGNTLTKSIQIGISNTVAVDGLTELTAVNHYADTITAFEGQGLQGQDLLDALREYAVETDRTGVDELNDQLLQSEPSLLSKVLPGQTAGTKERIAKGDDLRGQIESISKVNRQRILSNIAKRKDPSLNVFQGDLPNASLKDGKVEKILPGGNVRTDISIEQNFKRKLGADGKIYRVFEDGTFEAE